MYRTPGYKDAREDCHPFLLLIKSLLDLPFQFSSALFSLQREPFREVCTELSSLRYLTFKESCSLSVKLSRPLSQKSGLELSQIPYIL